MNENDIELCLRLALQQCCIKYVCRKRDKNNIDRAIAITKTIINNDCKNPKEVILAANNITKEFIKTMPN